ncbi:hypothetical protein LZ31DRAFT_103935 [Colletotrichum somersetense]|nr:hypothetical protein LZ31DRAFT_103935 [Colletotrichum somersetense]
MCTRQNGYQAAGRHLLHTGHGHYQPMRSRAYRYFFSSSLDSTSRQLTVAVDINTISLINHPLMNKSMGLHGPSRLLQTLTAFAPLPSPPLPSPPPVHRRGSRSRSPFSSPRRYVRSMYVCMDTCLLAVPIIYYSLSGCSRDWSRSSPIQRYRPMVPVEKRPRSSCVYGYLTNTRPESSVSAQLSEACVTSAEPPCPSYRNLSCHPSSRSTQ